MRVFSMFVKSLTWVHSEGLDVNHCTRGSKRVSFDPPHLHHSRPGELQEAASLRARMSPNLLFAESD